MEIGGGQGIRMMVVIAYDVSTMDVAGQKRLRRVAKVCTNYGQRVQNSVFECVGDASVVERVRHQLLSIIDGEVDSLRIYRLGNNYEGKIEQYGARQSYEAEGFLAL